MREASGVTRASGWTWRGPDVAQPTAATQATQPITSAQLVQPIAAVHQKATAQPTATTQPALPITSAQLVTSEEPAEEPSKQSTAEDVISISKEEVLNALECAFHAGTTAACTDLEQMMVLSYEAGIAAARATVEEELSKAQTNVQRLTAELASERSSGGGLLAQMGRAQQLKSLNAQVKALTSQLTEMTSKYNELKERLRVCSTAMLEAGTKLREELAGSKVRAKMALLSREGLNDLDEMTRRHINRLAAHVESELYGVGAGDAERTSKQPPDGWPLHDRG